MNASIDTNVIIHFYRSGCKDVLLSAFDKIYVHNFIVDTELKNHGSDIIYEFNCDVAENKITIVNNTFLFSIGMKDLFDEHFRETRILYSPQDLGEVYAIALAQTLGVASVVTDDIKQYGPHYTLMRMIDSEIIPLAFHEVLLLEFLSGSISSVRYIELFEKINESCCLNWDILSKTKNSIRRFLSNPDLDREILWMQSFCDTHGTDFKSKSAELLRQVNNMGQIIPGTQKFTQC